MQPEIGRMTDLRFRSLLDQLEICKHFSSGIRDTLNSKGAKEQKNNPDTLVGSSCIHFARMEGLGLNSALSL